MKGKRKLPPLAIGDKVLVQNQIERAPNKWDKSGVIVECKPHAQLNVMMDGSRKVSLRNRKFVRKINIPMPVAASGVKPAQFHTSQHGDVVDAQGVQGENIGVDELMEHGQVPESTARGDITGDDAGVLVDDHVNYQCTVECVERVVADCAVE